MCWTSRANNSRRCRLERRLVVWVVAANLALLAGCATRSHPEAVTTPNEVRVPAPIPDVEVEGESPPATVERGGETLVLVRMMDGGACQNDALGVQGVFMLYAGKEDIERIRREQGTGPFARYERMIEQLSLHALQEAVAETRIAEDPFALDAQEAHRKVVAVLNDRFRHAVAEPIREFERNTTLTIDVVPLAGSFRLYLEGCGSALTGNSGF